MAEARARRYLAPRPVRCNAFASHPRPAFSILALFGPDGLAKRGLFVGVKRTSIQGAPTSGNGPTSDARLIARTLIHDAGDWASQRLLAWRIAISTCDSRRKASLN